MPENNFAQQSYRQHETHYQQGVSAAEQAASLQSAFQTGTVSAWRHDRLRATILPLLKQYPQSSWLTVGDGRYGCDAHFLEKAGVKALASDISDVLLKEAAAAGYIRDFRRENAEALSFADDQFDFVLCKESYHHFPRPMVALYEMIRVARRGVVLIEPDDMAVMDGFRFSSFLRLPVNVLLNFLKRKPGSLFRYYFDNYETDGGGNYAYAISEREMEKVALGLNFEMVAFKGINDHHVSQGLDEADVFRKVKARIQRDDILCRLGVKHYKCLVAILLKVKPSDECQGDLRRDGFNVILLPRNPSA